VHPEVLRFFQENYGVKTAYYGYFKKGTCIGAVATWGSFIAGERYALRARKLVDRVDFGFPVLYLPVAQGRRCRIMFRARFLLDLQKRQIGWAFFSSAQDHVHPEVHSGRIADWQKGVQDEGAQVS